MKIMQVNCFYRVGSTGKMVFDLHTEIQKQGYDSLVCYGRRKQSEETGVYKVSRDLDGKLQAVMTRLFSGDLGRSNHSTSRLLRIIEREKPDVVHLHCLNGHFVNVYRLVSYLKERHIPTVLTLHAEIMHTAGCEHAMDCEKWKTECSDCPRLRGKLSRYFRDDAARGYREMKKAFEGFDELTIVGVSQWLTARAEQSPILAGHRFETIGNGVDTSVFTRRSGTELRKKLGLSESEKIILHVTPNFHHPIKGGDQVIAAAERLPEHTFIIVGFNGDPAVLPSNVIPIAHTRNQTELATYYSMADVTLLTSLRETFSLVCAESLCCGTPVVGYCAGGPETISIPMYSCFVGKRDPDRLVVALREWLNKPLDRNTVSAEAKILYNKKTMTDRYLTVYRAAVHSQR